MKRVKKFVNLAHGLLGSAGPVDEEGDPKDPGSEPTSSANPTGPQTARLRANAFRYEKKRWGALRER